MIEFLILVCVLGFILYMVNTYVPMAAPFKTVLNFVVGLILLILVLQFFLGGGISLPRLR